MEGVQDLGPRPSVLRPGNYWSSSNPLPLEPLLYLLLLRLVMSVLRPQLPGVLVGSLHVVVPDVPQDLLQVRLQDTNQVHLSLPVPSRPIHACLHDGNHTEIQKVEER